jgi:hypothetical protein
MSAALEQVEYVSTVGIPMRRVWAMPSKNTFDIPPIRSLVRSYLLNSKVSVDPFARNKRWATWTNDLNPETAAEFHLEAADFLSDLAARGVVADLGFFDPPYSLRQVKECYEGIGVSTLPSERTHGWARERDLFDQLIQPGSYVLSFGWNTQGFGIERGYQLVEILLVSHGREHNDTICTVERKVESKQSGLFP